MGIARFLRRRAAATMDPCDEEATDVAVNTTDPALGRDVSKLLPIDPRTRASLSILVVDDERVMRESCASYLEAEGYNLTVCSRGDKALETIKRRAFDIILVDLYMSQGPGT